MSGTSGGAPDRGRAGSTPAALRILVAVLYLEAGGFAVVTAYLAIELVVATPDSFVSAVSITVFSALASAWLAAIAIGTLRGRPWIRGAAITVQVLQVAIAVGNFQGLGARPEVGWLLLVPAIAVLLLLFTPPVLAATTRREGSKS